VVKKLAGAADRRKVMHCCQDRNRCVYPHCTLQPHRTREHAHAHANTHASTRAQDTKQRTEKHSSYNWGPLHCNHFASKYHICVPKLEESERHLPFEAPPTALIHLPTLSAMTGTFRAASLESHGSQANVPAVHSGNIVDRVENNCRVCYATLGKTSLKLHQGKPYLIQLCTRALVRTTKDFFEI